MNPDTDVWFVDWIADGLKRQVYASQVFAEVCAKKHAPWSIAYRVPELTP